MTGTSRPFDGLRAAVGFLTVVPATGTPAPPALLWFGPVGAAVGAVVGLVAVETRAWWTVFVAATVAVALDAVLTGGLHLDGLADSADGLLPPVDRSRRLAIMATPDVGAFGATALLLLVLLRAATLASVAQVVTVAALWAAGRSLAALVVLHVPYARADGLASSFRPAGGSHTASMVNAAVVASAAVGATAVGGLRSGLAIVAAVLTTLVVVSVARRRVGGFTGDVLGAAIVLSETVGLMVAVSR